MRKIPEYVLAARVAGFSFFLIPALSYCQVLSFQHYTLRDGLPSNHITAIHQDTRGYLWIGTDNGLSRYDGTEFKNFTTADGLSNLYITDIVESRLHPGTTWIGTVAGGLVRFSGNRFGAIRVGDNNISSLCEAADGSVWCTTGEGNFTIRNDSVRPVSPTDTHGSVIQAIRGDRIAIVTAHTLTEHRLDGTVVREEQIGLRAGEYVYAARAGREEVLWGFTSEGALLEMRGSSMSVHRLHPTFLPSAFHPPRIIDDGQGSLWITTVRGVLIVRKDDFTVRTIVDFGEPAVEPSGPILVDREGTIWLGTHSSGLFKLTEQSIFHIPLDAINDGSYNLVACADSNGHIWVATMEGLCEISRTRGRIWKMYRHPYPPGTAGGTYAALFMEPGGRLVIGATRTSPFSFFELSERPDGPSRLNLVMSLAPRAVASGELGLTFTVDRSRHGWFSLAPSAIAVIDLPSRKLLRTFTGSDGLPSDGVRAILIDRDGNAWCGSWTEGLAVAERGARAFHTVTEYPALPGAGVRSLYQDHEGTIWIGTRYAGLVRNRSGEFSGVSLPDGLLSSAIWSLAETEHRIWCGTDVGLEVVDKETGKPLPPKADLIGQRVYASGAYGNDYVWCVRARELVIYEQPEIAANAPPPPVYVTSCYVNGVAVSPDSAHEFNPGQNSCTIGFVGVSFRGSVRYQYRMLGHDSAWTRPGKEHTVTYASLRPGAYEFSVRAINEEGVASTSPATFAFVIASPVWQRWWFITAMGVFVASVLFGLFRYRLYHLMKMERMRLRIASDLHDDVGTNLSSIVVSTQIMEREALLSEGARTQLKEIGGVAAATQEMMRDIVWMLNPSNDSLDDFLLKMKEVAGRLLPGMSWRFIAPSGRLLERLSIDFKRNVFLIFKESLNNIAKHSAASEAMIEVRHDRGEFMLRISDNGRGFDPTGRYTGSGMANLARRAAAIGGSMDVQSQPGGGTTVTLSVINHANA